MLTVHLFINTRNAQKCLNLSSGSKSLAKNDPLLFLWHLLLAESNLLNEYDCWWFSNEDRLWGVCWLSVVQGWCIPTIRLISPTGMLLVRYSLGNITIIISTITINIIFTITIIFTIIKYARYLQHYHQHHHHHHQLTKGRPVHEIFGGVGVELDRVAKLDYHQCIVHHQDNIIGVYWGCPWSSGQRNDWYFIYLILRNVNSDLWYFLVNF